MPDVSIHAVRETGFTLIEMMVTIALFSILAMLAVPSFNTWVSNTKVRTVTDSLQNGLRFAQAEAVRRSRPTVFSLTNSTAPEVSLKAAENGSNWSINVSKSSLDAASVFVQSGVLSDVGSGVTIKGPAAICFNSMGRLIPNEDTGVDSATCDTDTPPAYEINMTGADRRLKVMVALGGQVRMCDPARKLADSPDGCP